jgi:hypothetical protein
MPRRAGIAYGSGMVLGPLVVIIVIVAGVYIIRATTNKDG